MNIKGSTLIRATNADVAEDGTATIPNGVKIIGYWAFYGCTSLASVIIPNSVTSIGDGAFNRCTSLREIQSQGKIQKVVCIDGYVMTKERRRTIGETEYIDGKILIQYDNGRWKTEKCTAAIRDGVSAHGETARIALRDLKFKLAERRGAEQYENVGLDDVFSLDDMISMYRVITGACAFGVNHFIGGLNTVKERYTPREVIELTQNEYGGRAFREFFEKKGS